MMRWLLRGVGWLLGHRPTRRIAWVSAGGELQYWRPVIRCARCGRRELA